VAEYHGDELVVGRPYAGLVLRKLDEWQAHPVIKHDSAALGLVLIGVDARSALSRLSQSDDELLGQARTNAEREGISQASALELVHRCLRSSFRREYSGWVPTLGKNRIVDRVQGTYVIDLTRTPGPSGLLTSARLPRRASAPGAGVRVGLVDTRLIPDPWLLGAFETDASDIWDTSAALEDESAHHATFLAGLILQQAPGATVVHRAALDDAATSDSWQVALQIAALARSDLDVLNLSLGCATDDGQPPLVLEAALATLRPETVVVAAAGNKSDAPDGTAPAPVFPAALENVVAVGALDGAALATFSPDEPWVDVYAQGVDVRSTYGGADRGTSVLGSWTGTSFSAAIVSGAVAARAEACDGAAGAWDELRRRPRTTVEGRPVLDRRVPDEWPWDLS
jgi:hypothetical protein